MGDEVINVIGLGYIGLPTALALASSGNQVVGTDCNENVIADLKQGILRFSEHGLAEVYNQAKEQGICFTTEYQEAHTYIVAVPSPYDKRTRKINVHYIKDAVSNVLKVAPQRAILIIESTISPGTIHDHVKPLLINAGREDIRLAHAPERIIPGNMIYELSCNNRTIGAEDIATGEEVREIYQSFCRGDIFLTDIKTAEMTKVVENTFRDINIAFANELAKICREAGIDVYEVIRLANRHPRVSILMPGPGVGGHCIAVDPWFLVGDYPGLANIILAARKINDSMPDFVLNRIAAIMDENNIRDVSRVGLYGLTYKENVNDIRESPTLQILDSMHRHLSYGVQIYDPYVKEQIVENQHFSFDTFIHSIDMLVIMVAHDEIKTKMEQINNKIIFDTRNCMTNEKMYRL